MDSTRVAEISHLYYVYDGKEEKSTCKSGTGYLIRPTLVLTARHTLTVPDIELKLETAYDIRFLGDFKEGERHPWQRGAAVLRWQNSGLDLALLELKQKPEFLTDANADPAFGELGQFEQLKATGMGFPAAQLSNKKQDTNYVIGTLSPFDNAKSRGLLLQVTSAIPRDSSGWNGISGTALFVEQHLIGVVIHTDQGDDSFGPSVLRAIPVSAMSRHTEFCQLVFGCKKNPNLPVIPKLNLSEPAAGNDSICDADEQEESLVSLPVEEFLKLLSTYDSFSSYPEDHPQKQAVLVEIAAHAWSLIVDRSEITVRNKLETYRGATTHLERLIAPLRTIAAHQRVTIEQVVNFFEVGHFHASFLPDSRAVQGYSKLLRKLIVHLLYETPSVLCADRVVEDLTALTLREDLFWVEFFADIWLRSECGNIKILDDRLLESIREVGDRYCQFYPEKPIVSLWKYITNPLETAAELDRETLCNRIREIGRKSRKNFEFKWTIAAANRVLPLYETSETDRHGSDFVNELFEEVFDQELILKSPPLQFAYLKEILRRFLFTKKDDVLVKFEREFKKRRKFLPHQVITHLQLEYACCAHLFSQLRPRTTYAESMQETELGKMIAANADLLSSNLVENYLLEYERDKFYKGKGTISIDRKSQVDSFLIGYIQALYRQYAQHVIEHNHLTLREFPALTRVYSVTSQVANSVLISLERSLTPDYLQDASFYAKSTPMLSRIKRNDYIDLIREYVTRALEADQYSLVRNAHDIVWGLYTCYYYGDPQHKDEIQSLTARFGELTEIVSNDQGTMNPQTAPKVYWAYYAGIKWHDRPQEAAFVKALCAVEVPRETYQLSFREGEELGVEFPDAMYTVIEKFASSSLLAAALRTNFDSAELWNIMGTTLMVNRETARSLAHEYEKASHCYSIAKCFALWNRDYIQKYCFNYIKYHSLYLQEVGFELREDARFITNTAHYLTNARNRSDLFTYNRECIKPFLELLQNELPECWDKVYPQSRQVLSRLLKVEWLRPELGDRHFEGLRQLLRSAQQSAVR